MKLSFATLGCPSWSVEQIVAQAREMGFDGVELRGVAGEHVGPEASAVERLQIREQFAAGGVEIACIMGYTRFTVADPAQRAIQLETARKYIGLARDLGCPMVRVFGGSRDGDDLAANIGRVVAALRELAPLAGDTGVRLALETHDDWCVGANLAAVLDGVGHPAVAACWDAANSFFVEPVETTFAALRGRIAHVHFKDTARVGDAHRSRLPGRGDVPMRRILELLRDGRYTGYLSFEWEKKWEPDLEEPEVAFPHYLEFTTALMRELRVPRG